jgi:hypothetical protein
MKKHVDYEHANVVDMYFIEVSQRCYTSLEHFEKQNFKIFKIITLSCILQFFGNTSSYKKVKNHKKISLQLCAKSKEHKSKTLCFLKTKDESQNMRWDCSKGKLQMRNSNFLLNYGLCLLNIPIYLGAYLCYGIFKGVKDYTKPT